MSVNVEHNVLWLHVPVDDLLVMHVLKAQEDLAEVEFSSLLIEALVTSHLVDMEEQFSSRTNID